MRKERLARAFNVHLKSINRPINLFESICPEACIRAEVEHPFWFIKRQFGHVKLKHQGVTKNTTNLMMKFGLSNLWMVRKQFLSIAQVCGRPKPAEGPATGAKSILDRHEVL